LIALLGISGYADNISPLTSMIPAVFAKIASCVNPYLYACSHPRFRNELQKIFCKVRRDSASHFQTSYHSRGASVKRRGRLNESESIEIEAYGNGGDTNLNEKHRPPLNRAESSFCDDTSEV
jgi:r-opsin